MDKVRNLLDKLVVFLKTFKKLLMILAYVLLVIGAYFLGTRAYELGHTGKLKGASVKISGQCMIDGYPRIPALNEDQVKITSEDADKVVGVIRLTREVIECKRKDIAIDVLPMFKDFKDTPVRSPELTKAEVRKTVDPEWKKYKNKTLLVSGTCQDSNGQTLAPFPNKKVDVTNVKRHPKDPEAFIIYGIREDNQAINCLNTSIKYEIYEQDMSLEEIVEEKPVSLKGREVLVTGKCFPLDEKLKQKNSFLGLTNQKVKVILDSRAGNEIVMVRGVLSDERSPAFGAEILCDRKKSPFIYDEIKGIQLEHKGKKE
tara:strand:+ start:355 stop:1299 length:945 start_codon:yes stop_codon:yes gene_type:complete